MAGSEPAQKPRLGQFGETDERHLVEAAQRDRACFGAVYEKYFALVYAYIARRVRERAVTEDLTSEVFRKALANLPRFKWTGAPFGAWLLRIASNLIADRLKRLATEQRVSIAGHGSGSTVTEGAAALRPRGAVSVQPQQTDLEVAERCARLIRLVDELPEDQRRVIRMRFAEEKSMGEMAAELGRSEGAVKQLQFRALKTLRAQLAKSDE